MVRFGGWGAAVVMAAAVVLTGVMGAQADMVQGTVTVDTTTFEGAWKSQHIGRRLSGITFTIGETKNIISEEFLVGGRNNTFSLSSDEYVIELKSTSPRLVGRIRTRTPIVDVGSRKAGFEATFDLAVARR